MPEITVTLHGDAPKANKCFPKTCTFILQILLFVEYQTIFEYRCLTCIAKIHKIRVFYFRL